jgi:restriction endonuclease S subunit
VEVQNWLLHNATGTTMPSLNQVILGRVRIPFAPVSEQHAIAKVFGDVDALLDGLTRLIAKKRDLKQAAMQQLLTGRTRLPGFHDKWEAKRLSEEISDLIAGVSVRSVEFETPDALVGPSILKTSAVNGGRFLPDEAKPIAPSEARRVSLTPRADSVLISRMNTIELVGECGYVESDYANRYIPDRIWMTRFRPNAMISAKWLAYTLTSESAREKLRGIATGTSGSMKNISKSAFLGLYFDVPSLAEQTAIATVLFDMDAELAALEARRAKMQALKQAMMQSLLTGRIRLVSPEPAHA